MIRNRAIRTVHANVVTIYGDNLAYDANGVEVALDESAIVEKSAELELEKAWSDLREKRNRLIAETDWEVVMHKELGTDIPTALTTYRQELRDLPANTSDPSNPSWPVKP